VHAYEIVDPLGSICKFKEFHILLNSNYRWTTIHSRTGLERDELYASEAKW